MKININEERFNGENFVLDKERGVEGTLASNVKPWLKYYNISLEEFLTNKKYIVVVDGDEYCVWSNIKDSGLVDVKKIIHDSYEESEAEWREQYLARLEKEKKDANSKHED